MRGFSDAFAGLRGAVKRGVVMLATHGLVPSRLADRLIQGLGLVHD